MTHLRARRHQRPRTPGRDERSIPHGGRRIITQVMRSLLLTRPHLHRLHAYLTHELGWARSVLAEADRARAEHSSVVARIKAYTDPTR